MARRLYVYYLAAGLNEAGEIMFARLFSNSWTLMNGLDYEVSRLDGEPEQILIAEVDEDRPFSEVKDDARNIAVTVLTNRQLVWEQGISTQAVILKKPVETG